MTVAGSSQDAAPGGGAALWLPTGLGGRALLGGGLALVLVVGSFLAFRPQHRVSPDRAIVEGDVATHQAANVVAGQGGPPSATAEWVRAENARPGTTGWRLVPGPHRAIEGFADHASAQQGDLVQLFVSTSAPVFHVEAYRMGFYAGLGARLVWRSADTPGFPQPAPDPAPGTNLVETRWSPSLVVRPDTSWPPGDYLFKLVTASAQQYVPLTLRDDASHAAYVVQNSVATWQAYNLWGGYDLYEGRNGGGSDYAHRARVVSLDRPYTIGDGSGDFLGSEYQLVSLVESLGLDVTYWTDLDLHRRPELLLGHRALISLGHDEYWSTAMRAGAQAALDRGVNLAFFGANAIFRHIRVAPSLRGEDRRIVDYKSAHEDPASLTDRSEVTVDWREPPLSQPESSLIGNLYECNPVRADMVVSQTSSWVFGGTGLHDGDHLAGVVGSEYDRYTPGPASPPNVEVLAHSPVRCGRKDSFSDLTYYSAPSGAGVFAAGTTSWIPDLGGGCADRSCPGPALVRITENVLAAFGAGPAGRAHPSVGNYAGLASASPGPGPGGTPPFSLPRGTGLGRPRPIRPRSVGRPAARPAVPLVPAPLHPVPPTLAPPALRPPPTSPPVVPPVRPPPVRPPPVRPPPVHPPTTMRR